MSIRMKTGAKVRKANPHFFDESGLRNNRRETQHPYLILRPTKTQINIDLAYSADELLELPDNTRIMAQWKGKKRSDFYSFKVSDLRRYITEHPPTARQKV